MITLIYGENNFLVQQALAAMEADYGETGIQEVYEGNILTPDQLPSLLQSVTLFSPRKQVIIKLASENKAVWSELPLYIENLDSDINLILVEDIPDKRTKTFKLMQKIGVVKEYKLFSHADAVAWVIRYAETLSIGITRGQAIRIVDRVGVDTWKLYHALEKLRAFTNIEDSLIDNVIDTDPQATVFELIDSVLARDAKKTTKQLQTIKASQDPYQFFGLLSQQLYLLITLSLATHGTDQVAKDLGVHPYPLQKMAVYARRTTKTDREEITNLLLVCDDQLKRSGRDPWLVIEQAILKSIYRK